jgi:hypothetical protein
MDKPLIITRSVKKTLFTTESREVQFQNQRTQDPNELNAFQSKMIVVLFSTTEDNETLIKVFNTLSVSFDNITFQYPFAPEVKQVLDLTDANSYVILRNFNDGKKILAGDNLTVESMLSFLTKHRYPLVVPFDKASE